jgi:branched-chain amino acid transport system permease protein
VLQRLANAPMIMTLLATYAISTILVNVAILTWGGGYQRPAGRARTARCSCSA